MPIDVKVHTYLHTTHLLATESASHLKSKGVVICPVLGTSFFPGHFLDQVAFETVRQAEIRVMDGSREHVAS